VIITSITPLLHGHMTLKGVIQVNDLFSLVFYRHYKGEGLEMDSHSLVLPLEMARHTTPC
jgi:hypothetical protein